jgi:hypothetical protein
LLYISWKHHEKDYILKGSPIMTAMLATQNTKPKAELRGQGQGQARVRFADEVQSTPKKQQPTVPQQPRHPTVGRAPPKSVTSYEPPNSFLDALEKGPVAEPRKDSLADFMMF